jgi:hypothetical protein
MKRLFAICIILLLGSQCGFSQGFVNLDFENPILPLTPVDFQVPTADALPGWTSYTYGVPSSKVVYNSLSIGEAAVSLQGPGTVETIPQGNYAVILQGSFGGTPGSAAIGQTGQIPQGAKSLVFFEGYFPGAQVTFSGQAIPLVQLGATPDYDIFAGDISAFAGQTGELRFTAPPNSAGGIDNIQFSVSPVPEPATLALLATGAFLLAARRKRK